MVQLILSRASLLLEFKTMLTAKLIVRKRRQRGTAIVETALVLVPLMALLLAVADFAKPVFIHSTFTHAVREGCRYGITYQTTYNGTTYTTQTDAIKAVV